MNREVLWLVVGALIGYMVSGFVHNRGAGLGL